MGNEYLDHLEYDFDQYLVPMGSHGYSHYGFSLYVLRAGEFYKVGLSKNIERRIKDLQTGCPLPIELVELYQVRLRGDERAYRLESLVHKSLKEYQTIGEWFVDVSLPQINHAIRHVCYKMVMG